MVVTIAMFAIVQGMYLLKEDEDLRIEKERKQNARARTKKTGAKKKARTEEKERP